MKKLVKLTYLKAAITTHVVQRGAETSCEHHFLNVYGKRVSHYIMERKLCEQIYCVTQEVTLTGL